MSARQVGTHEVTFRTQVQSWAEALFRAGAEFVLPWTVNDSVLLAAKAWRKQPMSRQAPGPSASVASRR